MSGRPPRRGRPLLVLAALAVAAGALTVPATSGAFSAVVTDAASTAKAASRFTCANTFAATSNRTNAYFEYQFTKSNATAVDSSSSGNTGSFQPGGEHPVGTADATTACPNDTGGPYYYAPNGTTNWVSTTSSVGVSPATFSLAAWFRTTAGGYLIGLNAAQDATSAVYDRHVYIDTAGRPVFGTYSGVAQVVTGPSPVNDGRWHQVVATFSAGTGMTLWIDGAKVAANATYTTAEADTGWWSIGYGRLSGWPSAPASTYFTGGLRFVAAYKVVLSDAEIAAQYGNGVPGP